ncbi:hypothetical protein PLANPX_3842 [Lacipirellula parvula]|uniref:Uncharacterized protein n=1 Tax=Lacipirellula parvula TaxID=2650471 RepID=A0A5K7XBP3_9BACT|nr:hypothetical protein PLANPX_3842 [Lacipirellula parvula]
MPAFVAVLSLAALSPPPRLHLKRTISGRCREVAAIVVQILRSNDAFSRHITAQIFI